MMRELKIATWNVNSVRTRLPSILDWIEKQSPDVLCLQETKVPDELFPAEPFREAGYEAVISGQKAYNGVAMISRQPAEDVTRDFPGNPNPDQKRFLAITVGGVRIVNVYIPNGVEISAPQFAYKLEFFKKLGDTLIRTDSEKTPLVVVGDLNVAPEDRDVHNPARWEKEVLFHPDARAALAGLMETGLVDVFRIHHDESEQYTWWDYRLWTVLRNRKVTPEDILKKTGLRIDHILVTPALAERCIACEIDTEPRKQEKPSDHTPVMATFRMS